MKIPGSKDSSTKVDMEFVRGVNEKPAPESKEDESLTRDNFYGGEPDDLTTQKPDVEHEKKEWESRYGTEESRDQLGFDGDATLRD